MGQWDDPEVWKSPVHVAAGLFTEWEFPVGWRGAGVEVARRPLMVR